MGRQHCTVGPHCHPALRNVKNYFSNSGLKFTLVEENCPYFMMVYSKPTWQNFLNVIWHHELNVLKPDSLSGLLEGLKVVLLPEIFLHKKLSSVRSFRQLCCPKGGVA